MSADDVLSITKKLVEKENYWQAIQLLEAENLKQENMSLYRELAYVYSLIQDRERVLLCRRRVIALGSVEPADYYDLSRVCVVLGNSKEAVENADKCISECLKNNFMYYFQSAHFWKAIALIDLNLFAEAKVSLGHLDDGFKTYVSSRGMVSKEMLQDEVNKKKKLKIWKFD